MKRNSTLALIALAASLSAQSKPGPQQDSATFDADGTAHITRVVPMPTTISPEAQTWLESLTQSNARSGNSCRAPRSYRRLARAGFR